MRRRRFVLKDSIEQPVLNENKEEKACNGHWPLTKFKLLETFQSAAALNRCLHSVVRPIPMFRRSVDSRWPGKRFLIANTAVEIGGSENVFLWKDIVEACTWCDSIFAHVRTNSDVGQSSRSGRLPLPTLSVQKSNMQAARPPLASRPDGAFRDPRHLR
jgi:hypothetical protein